MSNGPIKMAPTPGTAAISSIDLAAETCSACATSTVSWLACAMLSVSRRPNACARATPMLRSPSGEYFAARTAARACAAPSTWGTITPIAPVSSALLIQIASFEGTRTMHAQRPAVAWTTRCTDEKSSSPCSMSTKSQSKPAPAKISAASGDGSVRIVPRRGSRAASRSRNDRCVVVMA